MTDLKTITVKDILSTHINPGSGKIEIMFTRTGDKAEILSMGMTELCSIIKNINHSTAVRLRQSKQYREAFDRAILV